MTAAPGRVRPRSQSCVACLIWQVAFAPLLDVPAIARRLSAETAEDGEEAAQFAKRAGFSLETPSKLVLHGPRWGDAPPVMFPSSFTAVVALLFDASQLHDTLVGKLPWDVWNAQVLPRCEFDAFECAGAKRERGVLPMDGDEDVLPVQRPPPRRAPARVIGLT